MKKIPSNMSLDDRKTLRAVTTHLGLKYKHNEAIVIFRNEKENCYHVSCYNFDQIGDLRKIREDEIVKNLEEKNILGRIFKFRDSFARLSGFLQLRQMISYLYLSWKAKIEVAMLLKELENNNYKRPNSKDHEQRKNP